MTPGTRWTWLLAATVATGAALVLAFVLSFAAPGGFYERHFVWLFWVNAAVAVLLGLVLGLAVKRLASRLKRGKFGTRLLIKLAGIFAVVGVLPGLIIYTVSYQFASRSIDNWFDVKVAGALDSGLSLGRATLEALSADLLRQVRFEAAQLPASGSQEPSPLPVALERVRVQLGAHDVALVNPQGQIAVAAGSGLGMSFSAAGGGAQAHESSLQSLLAQARSLGAAAQAEGVDEDAVAAAQAGRGTGPRLRAVARLPTPASLNLARSEERYLLVVRAVPVALAANALAVQGAYSQYQERALARDSLKRMYVGTLTLALLLAVFTAVLLAMLLGNQLAKPLLMLADGVQQVAAGDYTERPVFASSDELGGLTRSFAQMTAQVAEARSQVQRGVVQLEGARTRLQTILDTLTAGVIVFDREGRVDTVNPGATRILQEPLMAYVGQALTQVPRLEALASMASKRFDLLRTSPEAGERDHWQESVELGRPNGATQSLLVRGAVLPAGAHLMVFDDISDVVSAQRSAAWAEVARRLAHEIRNPLTPIQLSAERMAMKLGDKLQGADQALLQRSVNTIVAQVAAMQALVSEFRDYARLPTAQPQALDLAALAQDVLGLYGQAQDAGLLHSQLDSGLPLVMGDATQLRQVMHNLLQNAMDAVAGRGQAQGQSDVHTTHQAQTQVTSQGQGPGQGLMAAPARVQLAVTAARGEDGHVREVRLTVQDNGPGFAEKVLKRAFEPYVTTKAKGTGLGLAVVKKVADEHGARLRAVNLHAGEQVGAPVVGARVSLSFSTFAPLMKPQAGVVAQARAAAAAPAMTPFTTPNEVAMATLSQEQPATVHPGALPAER